MIEPNKTLPPLPPSPTISVAPYLIAAISVFLIAVAGGIILETLRPDKDNSALILQIFGFAIVLAPMIFTLKNQRELAARQEATHILVNSRLSALLESSQAAKLAEGIKIGRDESDARTDKLQAQVPVNTVQLVTKIDTGPLTGPLKDPPTIKE